MEKYSTILSQIPHSPDFHHLKVPAHSTAGNIELCVRMFMSALGKTLHPAFGVKYCPAIKFIRSFNAVRYGRYDADGFSGENELHIMLEHTNLLTFLKSVPPSYARFSGCEDLVSRLNVLAPSLKTVRRCRRATTTAIVVCSQSQDVHFHDVGWKFIYGTFVSFHPLSPSPRPLDVARTLENIHHLLNMQNSLKFSLRHSPPIPLGDVVKHQQEVLICCYCNQEPPTRLTKTIPPRIQSKLKLAFVLVSKRCVLRYERNPSSASCFVCPFPAQSAFVHFLNFISFWAFTVGNECKLGRCSRKGKATKRGPAIIFC